MSFWRIFSKSEHTSSFNSDLSIRASTISLKATLLYISLYWESITKQAAFLQHILIALQWLNSSYSVEFLHSRFAHNARIAFYGQHRQDFTSDDITGSASMNSRCIHHITIVCCYSTFVGMGTRKIFFSFERSHSDVLQVVHFVQLQQTDAVLPEHNTNYNVAVGQNNILFFQRCRRACGYHFRWFKNIDNLFEDINQLSFCNILHLRQIM